MSSWPPPSVAAPRAPLFYQLYKHKLDHLAAQRIREVEQLGYKAIWLTVDAVTPGNRERDVKSLWGSSENGPGDQYDEVDMSGTAGLLTSQYDADMSWDKVRCVVSPTRAGTFI
jgi:L-lactate dehydrogenase (cytochrome)